MKETFRKYKVGFIITIVVFVVLSAITTARLILAQKAVKLAVDEKTATFNETDINDLGWNIIEIQEKKKEVHWLDQQLLLAKSDSLNLGINLSDSIVQVQLKGTALLQANILKQYPVHFMESPNYAAYLDFTAISRIIDEQSTIPKKPIKKVKAPKNESEVVEVKHDTIQIPPLVWRFTLDNKIEVVITGVGHNPDSTLNLQFNKDIINYSFDKLNKNLIPKNFLPTFYIWLDDKDAKAIYRAIPEGGKVVFKI